MAENLLEIFEGIMGKACEELDKLPTTETTDPSAVVQISKGTTVLTKSDLKDPGMGETVPVRYFNIPMYVTPPNANASGGVSGGGSFQMCYVTVAVDKNANIGGTAQCFLEQDSMTLGIKEVSKAGGQLVTTIGYNFKDCFLATLPLTHKEYRVLVFRVQNVEYLEKSFDQTGKDIGVIATGTYSAAKGG